MYSWFRSFRSFGCVVSLSLGAAAIPAGAMTLQATPVLEGPRVGELVCSGVNETGAALAGATIALYRPDASPLLPAGPPASCGNLAPGGECSLRYEIAYPENVAAAYCEFTTPLDEAFVPGGLRYIDRDGVTVSEAAFQSDVLGPVADVQDAVDAVQASVDNVQLSVDDVQTSVDEVARNQDGVVPIYQACAEGPGCFPGDAPGFPVEITETGSYRLTTDLEAPRTTGILVSAEDVTIDLNGFTLWSDYNGTGSGYGIDLSDGPAPAHRATIMNGTIRGFPWNGIRAFLSRDVVVKNLVVTETLSGIDAFAGRARIENSNFSNNRGPGIWVGPDSIVADTIANNNGFADGNKHGIYTQHGSIVVRCVASENAGAGFYLQDSSLIDSTASSNGLAGLDGFGTRTNYRSSTLFDNNGGDVNPQVSGPATETGINFCGTNTNCP